MKNITACAMMSCGSRKSMPAAWMNLHDAKRTDVSRSSGTPSSCERDTSSCAGVAKGFTRLDVAVSEDMITRTRIEVAKKVQKAGLALSSNEIVYGVSRSLEIPNAVLFPLQS